MSISTPVVVPGEIIPAAWGNQVRADLIGLDDDRVALSDAVVDQRRELGPHQLRYVPSGDEDGGAGGYSDWLVLGNVTVPTIAVACVISFFIARFVPSGAGRPEYLFRGRIGTVAEANPSSSYYLPASTTEPNYLGFAAYIIAPDPGVRSVAIQVSRTSGTNVIRANTTTLVTAHVQFRG